MKNSQYDNLQVESNLTSQSKGIIIIIYNHHKNHIYNHHNHIHEAISLNDDAFLDKCVKRGLKSWLMMQMQRLREHQPLRVRSKSQRRFQQTGDIRNGDCRDSPLCNTSGFIDDSNIFFKT